MFGHARSESCQAVVQIHHHVNQGVDQTDHERYGQIWQGEYECARRIMCRSEHIPVPNTLSVDATWHFVSRCVGVYSHWPPATYLTPAHQLKIIVV